MPPRPTKRDEVAMRFSSFFIPHQINTKNTASIYLRNETQTLWHRNAAAAGIATTAGAGGNKRKRVEIEDQATPTPSVEVKRGSQTIVIHPGSRWLRIGRASDVYPVSVPHVIARKLNAPVPPPVGFQGISRPRKRLGKMAIPEDADDEAMEDYEVPVSPTDDPVDVKIAAIRQSLRGRMQFYKIKALKTGSAHATSFNTRVAPEIIAEHNDPYRIAWQTHYPDDQQVVIGGKVFLLADPHLKGYDVRWPFRAGRFNTRDYKSAQVLMGDIEAIWRTVLAEELGINVKEFSTFSVILVVPDLFDRCYIRELVHLLLTTMGFKQVSVQQESLCSAYGSGISSACVIDMGATKTSVACVDEGMVIPDTRILLNVGGDDVTEMLCVLLKQIEFPYKEVDLGRIYDWNLLEELKERFCTLDEAKVALNMYDFVIRKPGRETQKFVMRAYDEFILAAMCIFEPRLIDFEAKKAAVKPLWNPDVDEILESAGDLITHAMLISTQHLLVPPPVTVSAPDSPGLTPTDAPMLVNAATTLPAGPGGVSIVTPPYPAASEPVPTVSLPVPSSFPPPPNVSGSHGPNLLAVPTPTPPRQASPLASSGGQITPVLDSGPPTLPSLAGKTQTPPMHTITAATTKPTGVDIPPAMDPQPSMVLPPIPAILPPPPTPHRPNPNISSNTTHQADTHLSADAAITRDILHHYSHPLPPPIHQAPPPPSAPLFPGGYTIDVPLEASKLPLDVAIFNSARGAGGGPAGAGISGHEDKVRKYLQAVLLVGGASRVHGMTGALESRLQAIATPLIPNMEKVQILVPPKDIDSRVLCWKGASVLGKLDAITDLWVKTSDWDVMGMRAMKERSFFM